MMYPLVRELAAEGMAVTVICGVLGLCRQAYYRWLDQPYSDRDWDDAHLVNRMIDIHHDDPAFGYRFIADELHRADIDVGENRVHRLAREHRIHSSTVKKGRSSKPGPAVHDDLVQRDFDVDEPNTVWLTDIERHEALTNPVVVKGHHEPVVAAAGEKLRAA